MKKYFFKDISAGALQVILNQAMGLLVFILLSRYLAKPVYGELNWSLALLTFITTLLSLRLEQVIVRRVAAGDDPSKMLTLFAGHIFFSGVVFYAILLLASVVFSGFFKMHNLILFLAISQLLVFFSSPFKQLANGKEKFAWLAAMSVISNFLRAVLLLLVLLFSALNVQQVLLIYIISSTAELLFCFFVVQYKLKISISSRWKLADYFALLKESLPQISTVILNAGIARLDWILLGIFSGSVITAEYSFAYKLFEICPLPLLILGPVLLSRFSKYFSIKTEITLLSKKDEIGFFIRCQMIAATFIPLVLNIIWTPFIDLLTGNKYGAVNKTSFFLLSLCVPLQYMINLMWTVEFAQNRLKRIFRITAITCVIIITGDALMIPFYNAKGAAIIYLLATSVEYGIYLRLSILKKIKESWQALLWCTGIALLCGFLVEYMGSPLYLKLLLAIFIYVLLIIFTRQIRKNDFQIIKELIKVK
jgi:O-antigen/teichoic acid export membrane protein